MAQWYEVILWANTGPDPLVADAVDLNGYDEEMFLAGRVMPLLPTEPTFRSSKPENDGTPDDVLQAAVLLPVFSQRLTGVLTKYGIGGVQYIPAKVYESTGRELSGFSIVNVLSVVPALDLDHSQYRRFPTDYLLPRDRGQIASVERPVLKAPLLTSLDVVRLREFDVSLFVSERFVWALQDRSCTGMSFRHVEVSEGI